MTDIRNAGAARLLGIDVSRYQGTVDWAKVKAAGCKFAFIKATEGRTWVDPMFARNWRELKEKGIPRGAYHFFRTDAPLQAQIDNFCNTVGSLEAGDLPPVLDVEVPSFWNHLSVKQRLDLVNGWQRGVEQKLGVKPIIYLSTSFATDVLKGDQTLAAYILWLAHYTAQPNPRVPAPWTTWDFWQWSENGTIDGIKDQKVDMNFFNGTEADLERIKVPAHAVQHLPVRKPGGTGWRRIASLLYFTINDLVNGRPKRG